MSYCCDRARSITWGIEGGLPSIPHGVWLNPGAEDERFLGAVFSNVSIRGGDTFTRPSAGGGGFGDPLDRNLADVLEDVIDGYVSIDRAAKDYGVVIRELDPALDQFEIDNEATAKERERIRALRLGWLAEDPVSIAERYRAGELDPMDLIRQYGVIVDWGTGELLANTTAVFRDLLQHRSASHWANAAAEPTG
jgi:N-methylhydantoinase B